MIHAAFVLLQIVTVFSKMSYLIQVFSFFEYTAYGC